MPTLSEQLQHWVGEGRERIAHAALAPRLEQIGRVREAGDGVALVSGLPDARLDELLQLESGASALVVDLDTDSIGCVLLAADTQVAAGESVRGTGEVARVPVGEGLLGRVVDALGSPLDDAGPIRAAAHLPVERAAPAIVERASVTRALSTGLLAIDAAIPLGRGQRELIIGDRGTGKTAIAIDAIINQRSSDVLCIYAAIGQKATSVAEVIDAVRRYGAVQRCVFVVGEADAPPGLQWLTPYAACSIGEHFMAAGHDVLLVLDDLTKHAAVHRQISLLLRRPPGREAYPGDVFYIHSRLLERSAKLSAELGGGSLTALPIAETQAGNISAYIPTNLISITDGQLYLDPHLFRESQKPAIDIGKSVSRVGAAAQPALLRPYAESLRLQYTQFLELEVFTRFGTVVDERTRRLIEHGRRIRAVLSQPQLQPLSLGEELALLAALSEGLLDELPPERIAQFRSNLRELLATQAPAILTLPDDAAGLTDAQRGALRAALASLVTQVRAAAEPH